MLTYLNEFRRVLSQNSELNTLINNINEEKDICISTLNYMTNQTNVEDSMIMKKKAQCYLKSLTYNSFKSEVETKLILDNYDYCLYKDSHKISRRLKVHEAKDEIFIYKDQLDNQKISSCFKDSILQSFEPSMNSILNKAKTLIY
jgi:hypothetical protein